MLLLPRTLLCTTCRRFIFTSEAKFNRLVNFKSIPAQELGIPILDLRENGAGQMTNTDRISRMVKIAKVSLILLFTIQQYTINSNLLRSVRLGAQPSGW